MLTTFLDYASDGKLTKLLRKFALRSDGLGLLDAHAPCHTEAREDLFESPDLLGRRIQTLELLRPLLANATRHNK